MFEKNNKNPQKIFSEESMRYRPFFTDADSQKIADTHRCRFRLIGTSLKITFAKTCYMPIVIIICSLTLQ